MANSTSLCGAKTSTGGTCRRKVSKPGKRCPLHKRSLNGKQILSLCFSVTDKVTILYAAYDVFERIHPFVLQLVHSLNGRLMPEHFWLGFAAKDSEEMRRQLQRAKNESRTVIEARYLSYSEKDKLRVEEVYREILRQVEP